MISPYSQSADFQIQPLDWNHAFQVGAIKEKRDDNLDALTAQTSAMHVPTIPGSLDEQKQKDFENQIHSNLSTLSDQLSKNQIDYRQAHRELLKNYYAFNTPEIQQRAQSYAGWNETKKGIDKLKETPGQYNPILHDQMLDASNYDSGKSGVWTKFPTAAINLDKSAKEAWQGLNKETSYVDHRKGSPTHGMMMKGVAPENIPDYAEQLAEANVKTPEGQQINQLYNNDGSRNPKDVLKDYYLHHGIDQQYGVIDEAWYRLQAEKEKQKPQGVEPDITSGPGIIENNPVDTKHEESVLNNKDNFDTKGTLKPPSTTSITPEYATLLKKHNNISDTPSFIKEMQDNNIQKFNTNLDENNPDFIANKSLIQNLRSSQPGIAYNYKKDNQGNLVQDTPATDNQVLNKWVKARKSLANQAIQKWTPSTTANSDFDKRFFPQQGVGDLVGKKLLVNTKDGLQSGEFDDLGKLLSYGNNPIPDEVLKTGHIVGIQSIGINGASYVANLMGKDGVNRNVLIPMDDEPNKYFRTSNAVFNILNSGKDNVYNDPLTGSTVLVRSRIDPSTGQFITNSNDPDKKPIKIIQQDGSSKEISLEELMQHEKKWYMRSGYVGSELYNEGKEKP